MKTPPNRRKTSYSSLRGICHRLGHRLTVGRFQGKKMSVITSIILTMSSSEPGFNPEDNDTVKLDRLDEFLQRYNYDPLEFLTPHFPPSRHPQTHTFGGGYNHFPEPEFIHLLNSFEWSWPQNVVLVMQPEEGATRVWFPKAAGRRAVS